MGEISDFELMVICIVIVVGVWWGVCGVVGIVFGLIG